MNIWRRLLHPWWRPTVIAVDLVGLLVIIGCFVYGYSISWALPFLIVNLVGVFLMWREAWITSEPRAQKSARDDNTGSP